MIPRNTWILLSKVNLVIEWGTFIIIPSFLFRLYFPLSRKPYRQQLPSPRCLYLWRSQHGGKKSQIWQIFAYRSFLGFFHFLNYPHGYNLTVIHQGESSQGRKLAEGFQTYWLQGPHQHYRAIPSLYALWLLFENFASPPVDLTLDLNYLAGYWCTMALHFWSIANLNLARILHDNNLSSERHSVARWVIRTIP